MPSGLIPLFDAVDKSQRAPAAVRVALNHPHFLETAWKSVPCRFGALARYFNRLFHKLSFFLVTY
jgi:hypothetical protein